MLTYSDGVGVALVVDAEPPQALIGRAARVAILHPEVGRRGDDEKHKGGHAAERASARQRVEHGVRERPSSRFSSCGRQQDTQWTPEASPRAQSGVCHIDPLSLS